MIFKFLIALIFLASTAAKANPLTNSLASPFTTTPASYIMASGTAATLLVYVNRKHWTAHAQEKMSTNKPLGKYSRYGDIAGQLVPNALYIGEQLIFDRPTGYRRSEHMFFATFSAALFANVLKYTVREKRPSSQSKTSFPSGHTTTAFAFASVVSIHHPWYVGVPAYALATFVGLSRVNDNKHYIHDVLAGATIGTAFGYGTYYANGDRYRVDGVASNFKVLPLVGPNEGGLLFSYEY